MKLLTISLLLIFLLPNVGIAQTERSVAVITHPDRPTITMTVTEAEKLLATTKDPILRHALVVALGTLGAGDPEHDLAVHERERFRWHRRPAQKSGKN